MHTAGFQYESRREQTQEDEKPEYGGWWYSGGARGGASGSGLGGRGITGGGRPVVWQGEVGMGGDHRMVGVWAGTWDDEEEAGSMPTGWGSRVRRKKSLLCVSRLRNLSAESFLLFRSSSRELYTQK